MLKVGQAINVHSCIKMIIIGLNEAVNHIFVCLSVCLSVALTRLTIVPTEDNIKALLLHIYWQRLLALSAINSTFLILQSCLNIILCCNHGFDGGGWSHGGGIYVTELTPGLESVAFLLPHCVLSSELNKCFLGMSAYG